ncbi:MAG: hypothetical protein ACRDI0_09810 [Actinomycetota bacterium]
MAGGWTLARRGRGRTLGLAASWFSATVWLLVLIMGVSSGTVDAFGTAMALVAIGGGLAVIVLLVRNVGAFDR